MFHCKVLGESFKTIPELSKARLDKIIELKTERDALRARVSKATAYCSGNLGKMWADTVMGNLLGCSFKDAANKYLKSKENPIIPN